MNNDSRNIGLNLMRLSFHFPFIYLFIYSFIHSFVAFGTTARGSSGLRSRMPEGYPRKTTIKISHLPRLVTRHCKISSFQSD